MLPRPKRHHQKAFTLIELLVVIAIIAILAAILFPVFAQAKAAAKTISAVSNIKQYTLAHLMYTNDNDDMSFIPWARGPYGSGELIWPTQILYPYMKSLGIHWDPSEAIPNLGPIADPTAPGYFGRFGTITFNEWGMYNGLNNTPKSMSSQEFPAEQGLITPLDQPVTFTNASGQTISGDLGWYSYDGLEMSCYDTTTTGPDGNGWTDNPIQGVEITAANWHQNGIPTGFIDGHTKSMKGMVFSDTLSDCGKETGDFWSTNFLNNPNGNPGNTPVAVGGDPWTQFFVQPRVLHYWNEWWTSND